MNTVPIISFIKDFTLCLNNRILLSFILLSLLLLQGFCVEISAQQKMIWRYVTTVAGGNKTYINKDAKESSGRTKTVWEKLAMPNGSFAIALADWDCQNKRRLTKEITFYRSNQTVIETVKNQFEWEEIIPGSATDMMYSRICLPRQDPILVEITILRAELYSFPSDTAPVLREAEIEEKFQIIPETIKNGWCNIVDEKTQQDYWIERNFVDYVSKPQIKRKVIKKKLPSGNTNKNRKSGTSQKRKY